MTKRRAKKSEIIPPEAYPQPTSKEQGQRLARTLRSGNTAEKAKRVVDQKGENLREVIRRYVSALESDGADMATVFAIAHEIRGFAGTAGLAATGRIADGLCRYLDKLERAGMRPDPVLTSLHINAIARAARAEDEASRMSEIVASELSVLVSRKLKELKIAAA